MIQFLKRHWLIIMAISALVIGVLAFHIATVQPPYEFYSKTFETRGRVDKAMDEYTPMTASDSLYALQVEIAQKSDELAENIIKQRPDYNAVLVSMASFLTLIGILFKILFESLKTKDEKEHKRLEDLLVKLHEETIFTITKVNDIVARDSIFKSLRKMAANYIHYNGHPVTVHNLIAAQAERLIELMDQVMDEKLSFEFIDIVSAKIDDKSRIAWAQVCELFGQDFLKDYRIMQEIAISNYKKRLLQIVQDSFYNNKYERFFAISESFLEEIIKGTIQIYKDHENNHSKCAGK